VAKWQILLPAVPKRVLKVFNLNMSVSGVNGDRLVVSDIICASKLEYIDFDLKSGQATR
jgi:hypothetical protein